MYEVAVTAVDAGRIRLEVYGTYHHLDLDPARALVDAVRDALRLAPTLAVGERQDIPTSTSHPGAPSVVK